MVCKMNYYCTKHMLYQMIIIYMAYYTQHGTECYKKIHFKVHSLFHKLCHRALVVGGGGCGGVL